MAVCMSLIWDGFDLHVANKSQGISWPISLNSRQKYWLIGKSSLVNFKVIFQHGVDQKDH